jgi:hypothetical protein
MLGQDTRKGRKNETCMARRVALALALSEWNWEGWGGCMHAFGIGIGQESKVKRSQLGGALVSR